MVNITKICFKGAGVTTQVNGLNPAQLDVLIPGSGGASCGYICGFLSEGGGSNVFITPGCARNDANDGDIVSAVPLAINIFAVGAGGRDAGPVSDGFWYVWLIKDTGGGTVSALISLSDTTPILPAGFDRQRRVGSVRIQFGNIIPFRQHGNSCGARTTQYLRVQLGGVAGYSGWAAGTFVTPLFAGFVALGAGGGSITIGFGAYVPPTSRRFCFEHGVDSVAWGSLFFRVTGEVGFQSWYGHSDLDQTTSETGWVWLSVPVGAGLMDIVNAQADGPIASFYHAAVLSYEEEI